MELLSSQKEKVDRILEPFPSNGSTGISIALSDRDKGKRE